MHKSKFLITLCLSSSIAVCNAQSASQNNGADKDIMNWKGKTFPSWTVNTVDGHLIDSDFFKGKVVLISYWYIGCLPCMAEITTLNQLYEHFKDSNVVILSVAAQTKQSVLNFNTDTSQHNAENSIRRYMKVPSMLYPVIANCDTASDHHEIGFECMITKPIEINSFPTTIIIDKKRIIQYIHQGFSVSSSTISIPNHKEGEPTVLKAGTAVTPNESQYSRFYSEIESLLR